MSNGGPAYLFRNVGGSRDNALRIRTAGTRSNRDGIGAQVRVTSGGSTNWQTVHSGSSYCSQSQGRVNVPSAGRPRRGRRSLAVGETHGKRRPWMFDPYGVEYLLAPRP